MARPEDTLARGTARNAGGFDQGYDDGLQGQRRDPRARTETPMRGPNQSGIPLAPDPPREPARASQPGVTPRFDPYLPQGVPSQANGQQRQQQPEQGRPYGDPRQAAPAGRQDPRLEFPNQAPQGYGQDTYAQQRLPQGGPRDPMAGALPARPGQPAPQQVPPSVGDRRYAAPAQPAAARPGTQGRPGQSLAQNGSQMAGQTARSVPQGYPAPAAGYGNAPALSNQEIVPPTGRSREPFFEAPQRRTPLAQPAAAQLPVRQPQAYAQDGYGHDPYAETAEDGSEDEEYDDEAEDEEADEAAPRSRRGLIVSAVLVIAIIIGGGLGYAYKFSLGGHAGKGGTPPVVQADKAPAKTIPADAGGQSFDTGKKTILDRATPDAGNGDGATVVPSQEPVAVATASAPADGQADALASPRKVATVVVKDGQPIQMEGVTVDPAAAPDEGVPGISLGGTDPAAKPAKIPDAAALKVKAKAAAAKAAEAAAAKLAAEPDAAGAQVEADAAVADVAQQPTKLAGAVTKTAKKQVKTVVAALDPAADPSAEATDPAAAPVPPTKPKLASAAASATIPAKSASGGYIIQVRSTKTQGESLAYFADLQQRYSDLLGASQPDIQEVDLGAKGKWFRLRIGPPGSGVAAKDLCTKLKTNGLKDCIVAAY